MYQQSTYTNWDFVDTWQIEEGVSYAELQVFAVEEISIPTPILSQPTQVDAVIRLGWTYS